MKIENTKDLIKIILDHEKRISKIENKKISIKKTEEKTWYKQGSTIEKIVSFIENGIFNVPQSVAEIMSELKTRDHHLEPSDLTLPLRKIVRKGLLRRTKTKSDGFSSKKWLYVKD